MLSDITEHNDPQRRDAMAVLHAALAAVDPAAAVRRHLTRQGDHLFLDGRSYRLGDYRRILVLGAGKASGPMAFAVEELLFDRQPQGLVIVKEGYTVPTRCIELVEASHPIPNGFGLAASRRIMALADAADENDLVIVLVSGGASALLVCPVEGVSLQEIQVSTDVLLRAGATISELNAVRKRLSQVKGGRLARLAAPATVLTLVVSDVVGSPLDIIGSGPTVPDRSTYDDALEVVRIHGVHDQLPPAVIDALQGKRSEAPKPGDPAFARVQNAIIASNELAAEAAVRCAEELGYATMLLSTFVQGEAREVGRVIAGIVQEIRHRGRPLTPPACIVSGGETTVTVRGTGRGGRNQELALAAAIALDGQENAAIIGLATDGTDGPTDAAGAWADGTTVRRAALRGLRASDYLANNDSYHFFDSLGDLIVTGPTNTNVNDLTLAFVWSEPSLRRTAQC